MRADGVLVPQMDDAFAKAPATVLDPFSGTGTTGVVAVTLGRDYVGIELKPEYAAMSRRRIREECGLMAADAPPLAPPQVWGGEKRGQPMKGDQV